MIRRSETRKDLIRAYLDGPKRQRQLSEHCEHDLERVRLADVRRPSWRMQALIRDARMACCNRCGCMFYRDQVEQLRIY